MCNQIFDLPPAVGGGVKIFIAYFESAGDEESFDYRNQGSTRLRLEVDFLKFVWSSTLRIFSKNVKN